MQFSEKLQRMHHSWTRSQLAPLTAELLRSLQTAQFFCIKLKSLNQQVYLLVKPHLV